MEDRSKRCSSSPAAPISWSTMAASIPHVFEAIVGRLSTRDLQVASMVCVPWEVAIAPLLSPLLALRVVREGPQGRELIPAITLDHSIRRYDELRVSSWSTERAWADWEWLMDALQKLDARGPIRCARIDEQHRRQRVSTPQALTEYGWVLSHLQELELSAVSLADWQVPWEKAFANFGGLKALTLHSCHGEALRSAVIYCPGLRRLALTRFAVTRPFREMLDFPELEELVIDELDANAQCVKKGISRLKLNNLKHLTFLISGLAAFDVLRSFRVNIVAPELRSARVSDLLIQFVRIEAGEHFRDVGFHIASREEQTIHIPYVFSTGLKAVTTATFQYRMLDCFFWDELLRLLGHCENIKTLIFEHHNPLHAVLPDIPCSEIQSALRRVKTITFKHKPYKTLTFNVNVKRQYCQATSMVDFISKVTRKY